MNECIKGITTGKDYLDIELLFGTNESKYGEIKLSLEDRFKDVPIKNIEIKEITYDVGPISVNLSTPINRPLVNMPFTYCSPFGKGIKCNLVYYRRHDGDGVILLGLKTSSVLKNTGAILRVVLTFGENIIEDVPVVESDEEPNTTIVKNGKETRLETKLDVFLYDQKPNIETEKALTDIALLAKTESIKCLEVLHVFDRDGNMYPRIYRNHEETNYDNNIRERVWYRSDEFKDEVSFSIDMSTKDGSIMFVPDRYDLFSGRQSDIFLRSAGQVSLRITFEERDKPDKDDEKMTREIDSEEKSIDPLDNQDIHEVVENIHIEDSVICKGTAKYNIESVKELAKITPLYCIEIESVIVNGGMGKEYAQWECRKISHNNYKIKIGNGISEPLFAYIQIAKDGTITVRSKNIESIADILVKFAFLSKPAFEAISKNKPTKFVLGPIKKTSFSEMMSNDRTSSVPKEKPSHEGFYIETEENIVPDIVKHLFESPTVDMSKPFLIDEINEPIPESGFVLAEVIVYKRSTPSIQKIYDEARDVSRFNKKNKELVKNGFRRIKTTVLEDDIYIRYVVAFEK